MELDEDNVPIVDQYPRSSVQSILGSLNLSFKNLITSDSQQAVQPPQIKIPLRMHQKALIHAMLEREKASMNGISLYNTLTYSNYGVLGDEVGSGKSLTILSYIAMLKNTGGFIENKITLYPDSSKHFFTVCKKEYASINGPCLIVTPHTIYRQWQDYCKKQTTLKVFYAKSNKSLVFDADENQTYDDATNTLIKTYTERDACIKEMQEADIVLVSNTLYSTLQEFANLYNIRWKRVFIDEVDSIYIGAHSQKIKSPFTWFITATWSNFIFEYRTIRPRMLEYYNANSSNYTTELGDWLREEIGDSYEIGRTTFLKTRSSRWLSEFYSDHNLRGLTLLKCSNEFLQKSRQMPEIFDATILCEQPAIHRALQGLVSPTIQNMLHAGNIEGALQELGVSSDTSMNLIDAATKEREKELQRLEKTLAFKASLDYASLQSKESALNSLRLKIVSIQDQLNTFRQRLSNIEEECPICYDNPQNNSATLTPCCHRIFCGVCILNSLSRNMSCPMCRANIRLMDLIQLVESDKKPQNKKLESKLLTKPKQLLKFLKENPKAQVLVFSRYENPFLNLERDCDTEGISYHTLRGNKDTIASTIRSFEKGEKRVLFLSTSLGGAGLNLVSATHVLLYHAMTPEEEKQIIGRAYRLGRSEPLHVLRLLHENETILNHN